MAFILDHLDVLANPGIFSYAALCSLVPGGANSRHALVKRALASGEIIQVRRGLYCLSEKERRAPLSLFEVAQQVYGPSYVSFESALSHHGWIPEAVTVIHSASQGKARIFNTPLGEFVYTRIPTTLFYEGVECVGKGAFIARPLRALLDLFYARKKTWRTSRDVEADMRIDAGLLLNTSRREMARYRKVYRYPGVRAFLSALMKEAGHER